MTKIQQYVMENWSTLPKSYFDEEELVIVVELNKDDEGWGHHSYRGVGISEDGRVFVATSSGCSCQGGPDVSQCVGNEIDVELSNSKKLEELDPNDINFDELQVTYNSY